MILSRWTRGDDTAEVLERHPLDSALGVIAWNITRGRYAILEELPEWARDVFRVGYFSGWRRNEILSLSWAEVDLDGRAIHLDAARSKNKEPRTIPFIGEIAAVIARRQAARALGCPYVFHHGGKPWSGSTLDKVFREAATIAGYPRALFHDCRASAYTTLRRLGVRPKVAREMIGWKSMVMPDRYERVAFEDKEEAAEKMREYLEAKAAEAASRVLPFAREKS